MKIKQIILRTSSLNEKDSTTSTFKVPDDVNIDSEQLDRFTEMNKIFYVICKLLKLEEIEEGKSTNE